jgi:hypothetical protein
MGLLDLLKFNQWRVTSLDAQVFLELVGQYNPEEGIDIVKAPSITESSTPGSPVPSQSWTKGGAEHWRFRSVFNSPHNLADIREEIGKLETLQKLDTLLGRAPRVRLEWGDHVLDGFAVLQLRHHGFWAITGLPRGMSFELDIVEAPILDFEDQGSTGETQYVVLGRGESFETLGVRYLGDALKGELLRRANPEIADGEGPGDLVKVLEREHPSMRVKSIRPTSPPFLDPAQDESTWQPLVTELATTRSRGLAWEQLPEVIAGEV